jgi:hypothetical protein
VRDRVRLDRGVVVQQQDPVAVRVGKAVVDGAREADVARQRQQLDVWIALADELDRAVAGRVVHHDRPAGAVHGFERAQQRIQARGQKLPLAVVRDDRGDGHAHGRISTWSKARGSRGAKPTVPRPLSRSVRRSA